MDVLKSRLEELFTPPAELPPAAPLAQGGEGGPSRLRVYRALNRVSQMLNRLAAPSEILELIFAAAGEALDNRNFSIALYDEANGLISFPIYSIDGERREVSGRPMGNGLTEYVIRTCAPLLLPRDVQQEIQKRGIDVIGRPASSLLSVPLTAGDQVVGVVTLQDYEKPDVYTTEHLELLTILASQAAGALENARLFERTRAALAETQQIGHDLVKFKMGIERSTEAMFITDVEGRITYANPAFEKVYGFGVEEALGKTPRIIKSGLIPQERYKDFWDALLSKQVVAGEIVNKTKDGRLILIDGSNNPILDDAGNLLGFLAVHRDITERRRAEEALSRRAVQLQAGADVSRAASSILNPDEPLPRVVDLIRDAFDLYYVGIFLVDRDGQYAVLRAGTGEAGRLMLEQGHRLEIGDSSMIGWCVAHCEPRVYPRTLSAEVAQDVGGPRTQQARAGETVRFDNPLLPETRSELALPLVSRGRVLGAMSVQSRQMSAFSEQDISALQTMADQVANAIANAQLFEQESRRASELAVINRVTQALSAQQELQGLLVALVDSIRDVLGVSDAYVALYDRHTSMIHVPYMVEGDRPLAVEPIPFGMGLTSVIIERRRPLLINRDTARRAAELGAKVVGAPAKSYLGVPILLGDEALGVIAVQSTEHEGLFGEAEERLLTTIAAGVGVAIQNARLFQQTQAALADASRRSQELAALNEMGRALASVLEVDAIYELIYEHTARLIDATNFFIALYDPRPPDQSSVEQEGQISFPIVYNDNQRISVPSRPMRSGLTDYVLRHRQPLLISEDGPAHMERLGIEFLALGNATPALSWLGVPMNYGDRILGAIVVQSVTTPALFRENDRDLLTAIASQTAIALENARLFEQTRRQLGHLATIQQTLSALTATFTREEMIDALLRHVAGAVRADTVSMFLIEGEHLVRVRRYASRADDGDPLSEAERDGGDAALRVGEAIALADYPLTRQVIETRRPLAFLADDARLQEHARQAFRQAGITASATLPLVGREGVLGTLAVSLRQPGRAFSRDELGLLQTLADQATVAFEKVRLLEETRRLAQHRHSVNQITAKIRSASSVDEVLRIATTELRQATRASRVGARVYAPASARGDGDGHPEAVMREPEDDLQGDGDAR